VPVAARYRASAAPCWRVLCPAMATLDSGRLPCGSYLRQLLSRLRGRSTPASSGWRVFEELTEQTSDPSGAPMAEHSQGMAYPGPFAGRAVKQVPSGWMEAIPAARSPGGPLRARCTPSRRRPDFRRIPGAHGDAVKNG